MAITRGLELIQDYQIGSANSSFDFDDVFSSTYDTYKIFITGLTGSEATDISVGCRLFNSNVINTSAEYSRDFIYYGNPSTGSTSASYTQNQWTLMTVTNLSGSNSNAEITFSNVNDATEETQGLYYSVTSNNNNYIIVGKGSLFVTTTQTNSGFRIFVDTGTIITGRIKIFGLKT